MEQYESSELMKTGRTKNVGMGIKFNELEVYKSVILPIEGTNEKILRVTVSQMSKRLNKQFRCVKHKEQGIFEVGRLPDEVESVKQQWDSSPEMKG